MSGHRTKALKNIRLSTPAALLIGCILGVVLMIFLPNPLEQSARNTRQNLEAAAQTAGGDAVCYQMLAAQAKAEGKPALSRLLLALTQAENTLAQNLHRLLGPTDWASALPQAIEREMQAAQDEYPYCMETAEHERDTDAMQCFAQAAAASESHAVLLTEAMEHPDADVVYFLCPTCGLICRDQAPSGCSVCGTAQSLFECYS